MSTKHTYVKVGVREFTSPMEAVTSQMEAMAAQMEASDPDALHPNTFWELIERLLLHSSVDEGRRQRHNAALSAICRGHALPRFPRKQKGIKLPWIDPDKTRPKSQNSSTHYSCFNSKAKSKSDANVSTSKNKSTKPMKKKTIPDKIKDLTKADNCTVFKSNHERSIEMEIAAITNCGIDLVKETADGTATATKSECNLKDHDVIFLKDINVPASERLWRFAMKNREKKNGEVTRVEDDEDPHEVLVDNPSTRSNQAIYEGLKQRLDDAKKSQKSGDINNEKQKANRKPQKKPKQKKSPAKANVSSRSDTKRKTSNKCKTEMKKSHNSDTKLRAKKKAESDSVAKNSTKDGPDVPPPPSTPEVHDSCLNEIKQLIDISEKKSNSNHKANSGEDAITPERYSTKKSQYDKVLKRRLNCGSQLETLNKEIVSRNLNPRTTLSRETTRKYTELKTDYLKLCYQESSLRHQIAMLQAEIYMMQNQAYHKQPATVKTITLDASTTRIPAKPEVTANDVPNDQESDLTFDDVMLFPPLKAPKRLAFYQQMKMQADRLSARHDTDLDSQHNEPQRSRSDPATVCVTDHSSPGDGPPLGICSLYSLATGLHAPQKRTPVSLLAKDEGHPRLTHRLPKYSRSTLQV